MAGALLSLFLLSQNGAKGQYAVNDYGTIASGNWNGNTTWGIWNGTVFVPTAVTPPLASTAWIRNGHTVNLASPGPYSITNLTVEAGGKLWTTNAATNIYMGVYGTTLKCDGTIGDGSNFDGISFNLEGANLLISGTGTFDCSRIRKNTVAPNVTTNVTIAINMNIRFQSGSTTQMYNNAGAASYFNVTVNAGVTVNLVGTSGTGNLAIDGTNGAVAGNAGGSYVVNGTINMNGILYLTTNNTSNPCSVIVNNGGVIRCSSITAGASGAATHSLTVNTGGRIEVQGTPTAWTTPSTTNNTYSLATGSTFEYSGLGPQNVWCGITGGYGGLKISGSGTKSLDAALTVKGNLDIVNTSGAPNLDVTLLSSFGITIGGNWTNYGTAGFNERSGLVTFNLGLGQTITTTGGERFYNLRLNKTVATVVSMGSDVNVGNVFTLSNGNLDLNQRRLTMENGLTTSIVGGAATRYIISEQFDNSSKVQWNIGTNLGAHLIPFGRVGGYVPFTFDLTAGDAGNVTISTYGTPAADNLPLPVTPTAVLQLNSSITGLDNSAATVDRFWQIDATGTPTADYTFTYRASELPASPYNTPTSMVGQWYEAPTNTWNQPLPSQMAVAYSVTVPGATQLGPWTLSTTASLLPIELISFTAEGLADRVELKWSTASELNNDHFTVYRSADAVDWDELLRKPGSFTSHQPTNYSDVDLRPLSGINYYKLRQTDIDGQWTESSIVAVDMSKGRLGLGAPYPMPANDMVMLAIPEYVGVVSAEVVDMAGRSVASLAVNTSNALLTLDTDVVPSGTYVLIVRTEQGEQTWPLLIAH